MKKSEKLDLLRRVEAEVKKDYDPITLFQENLYGYTGKRRCALSPGRLVKYFRLCGEEYPNPNLVLSFMNGLKAAAKDIPDPDDPNEILQDFVQEALLITGECRDFVSNQELWRSFCIWCADDQMSLRFALFKNGLYVASPYDFFRPLRHFLIDPARPINEMRVHWVNRGGSGGRGYVGLQVVQEYKARYECVGDMGQLELE